MATTPDYTTAVDKRLSPGCSEVTETIADAERRRPPPNFLARLHRQRVTVRQPGQPALIGVLVGYSPYELLISDDRGKDHLVFKGPGLVLDLPDGWRRSRAREAEDGGSEMA